MAKSSFICGMSANAALRIVIVIIYPYAGEMSVPLLLLIPTLGAFAVLIKLYAT